ncbi:MAG: ribosome-binding factor A [Bacteroidota bacterium]
MQSKRQLQVAEMIKRHFSIVLQQEGSYIYGPEPLVTVTEVHPTPDLSQAKIYLSIWNTENKQAVILQMEEDHQRLKSALAYRLKRHIRRIPAIDFYIDETLDEMHRVDNLFERLEEENQLPREKEE